jgi:hypothetical protein
MRTTAKSAKIDPANRFQFIRPPELCQESDAVENSSTHQKKVTPPAHGTLVPSFIQKYGFDFQEVTGFYLEESCHGSDFHI